MSNFETRINEELEKIRPALQMDGGDVRFISFDENTGLLKVQLLGMCSHCHMSQITLKQGIEAELKNAIPGVKEVEAV